MEPNLDDFHLADANDAAILMHRDVHFGGSFELMLEYYLKGGKGIHPDFEVEKIQRLADIEKDLKENLAGQILNSADAEKVAKAKEAYQKLRDLYEVKNPVSRYPVLLANLILSEEEEPAHEIDEIVKEKSQIVPSLIALIKSEEFHDPLFPGYGLAPALAMKCLSLIGDKRAIITFFETIGTGDFFDDDIALQGLRAIGEPAKKFLLTVVQSKPINADNEKAAIALLAFKDDPEVGDVCLKLLHEPSVLKDRVLSTYLILACEGLQSEANRQKFKSLSEQAHFPRELRQDLTTITKTWLI